MIEREGQGWRLAWDPQREPFPVLIGGDGWASELTAAEAAALQRALQLVQRQHRELADTLMEEETISLEFTGNLDPHHPREPGNLWVGLDGDRQSWALRFVLQPAPGLRGLEGAWVCGAAEHFARAFAALAWNQPGEPGLADPLDPSPQGD